MRFFVFNSYWIIKVKCARALSKHCNKEYPGNNRKINNTHKVTQIFKLPKTKILLRKKKSRISLKKQL